MDHPIFKVLDENIIENLRLVIRTSNTTRFEELMTDLYISANIEVILAKLCLDDMIHREVDILYDINQFTFVTTYILDIYYICSQVIGHLFQIDRLELLIDCKSSHKIFVGFTFFNYVFNSEETLRQTFKYLKIDLNSQFKECMEKILEIIMIHKDLHQFDITILLWVLTKEYNFDIAPLVTKILNSGYNLSPKVYDIFVYGLDLTAIKQLICTLVTHQIHPSTNTLIQLLAYDRFDVIDILVEQGIDVNSTLGDKVYVDPQSKYEKIIENLDKYNIPVITYIAAIENYYLSSS